MAIVHPSVTSRHSIKIVKYSLMQTMLHYGPGTRFLTPMQAPKSQKQYKTKGEKSHMCANIADDLE